MFTGLIEDVGQVTSFLVRQGAGVLKVKTALPLDEVCIGDSVAVNGACLTATTREGHTLTFDVSPETLNSTTLGRLRSGERVNLERALQLGARLGGHLVTGHVDCLARLGRMALVSGNHVLDFVMPPDSLRYVVSKGSVAIDGISLTVNSVTREGFSVNIIPHTFTKTTLATLAPGQEVNIETDIIGKYVERLLQPQRSAGGLSLESLIENGFA